MRGVGGGVAVRQTAGDCDQCWAVALLCLWFVKGGMGAVQVVLLMGEMCGGWGNLPYPLEGSAAW